MKNSKSKQKAIQAIKLVETLFILTKNQRLGKLTDGLLIDFVYGNKIISNKKMNKLKGIIESVMAENDIEMVKKAYEFVKNNTLNYYDQIGLSNNNVLQVVKKESSNILNII